MSERRRKKGDLETKEIYVCSKQPDKYERENDTIDNNGYRRFGDCH
jgi:hypothetical protein